MKKSGEIVLWDETATSVVIPANLTQPAQIAQFAKQLTPREKTQIVKAYKDGSYEMATSFLWGRAMASLKRELGALGITFLAELLGRTDIDEDDNVLDALTEKEAIKLAEELGMVSRVDGIRLRHSQELVAHFSQRDATENDTDEMQITDALGVLHSCVKSVLARPSIQVARKFSEFRKELETETFEQDDPRCAELIAAPYFFKRVAIAVLLSGVRSHVGAKLEHCLSNINLLLPLVWKQLRDPERWQIGTTYAQVYADGLKAQTVGLKTALLKVQGFDYVPETLRSQTYVTAAEAIIRAHEGMNNFYNEETPTRQLEKLGTVIPAPALGPCVTALLCVRLGNFYGTSWAASPIADRVLKKLSADRWNYYFDKVLPGEMRILEKLGDEQSRAQWIALAQQAFSSNLSISNTGVRALVDASRAKDAKKVELAAEKLISTYYGKQGKQ